ncbi:MAG: AAA family ATPase [Bacilli bacterium]|nr:AAA family ATPase [Bacilli bacterium]
MKLSEAKLKEEKKYLETVKEVIKEEIDNINAQAKDAKEEVSERKKEVYFMPLSDEAEITDEMNNINNKVDYINKRLNKIYVLEKALKNPYFGKVIVKTDQKYEAYIGINAIEKDYNYYVYDWRSPIASLFYNYGIGKASYKVDGKYVSCDLLDKFQYKIKDGELMYSFSSDININDDYLQELLSESSSEKLSNIINSIQLEQNEIIRDESNNNLIVQGIAGSGKTVVAMHRIAYLLYRDKDLLSNNILIVSPNDIFLEYISSVLPEMGEENTLATTFNYFAKRYLNAEIENYSEFIDRISNKKTNKNIKYKFDLIKDLEKYLKEYISTFNFNRKFTIDDVTFYSNDINELFLEKYKRVCFKERINRICEYVLDRLEYSIKFKKNIRNYLMDKINITTDIFDIYNGFLKEKKLSEINREYINYEDVTNLLYIYFYINGYPHYKEIKYVLIDEIQDYNKKQIEILAKIFNQSTFVLLGDINQDINPYNDIKSLKDFLSIFKNTKYIELNKTYRSSEEIINYSNKILGLNNAISIRKNNNEKVEEREYSISNIKKDIEVLKKKYNTIAIITEDLRSAKLVKKEFKDFELISSCKDTITNNIVIIPSYLSKGLEFDAVLIIKDDDIFDINKNLFYVSVTRAKSKLIVYKNKD